MATENQGEKRVNGRTRSADGGHIALQPPHQSTTPLGQPASPSSACGAPGGARSGANTPPAAASQPAACFGQPCQRSSRTHTQRQDYTAIRLPTRQQTSKGTAARFQRCAAMEKGSAAWVHGPLGGGAERGRSRAAQVSLLRSAASVALRQLTDVGRRSGDETFNDDPDTAVGVPGGAGTGVRPSL